MTDLQKMQIEALRRLLHRLSCPHGQRTHGEPTKFDSPGDYYTTLTFRSADLQDVLTRARAAVDGNLLEDVEYARLLTRRDELNRRSVQLEQQIEQARVKAQEAHDALTTSD